MAIEFDFNKKKEDEKQPQSAFGPTTIGAGQQSQQGQQKGTSSGRFTNIQNFLGANRAANLGGNIAGKIGQVTGQVQQEVGKEREAFQKQTQQAFSPFAGGREFAQQAIADPTKAVADQSQLARFQKLSSGLYSGPQAMQNTQQLQQQAQGAQQLAGLTTSEGGRQALLRNFFANPQYSAGQRNLDALLLQTDPNQLRSLASSRSGATAAQRSLSKAQQQSFAEAQGKAQEARLLGQETVEKLGSETGAREQSLQQKLEATQKAEEEAQAAYNRAKSGLAQGEISEDDAIRLGLLQPGTTDLSKFELSTYGADPLAALSTNIYGGPMTKAAVASQEEAARINALSKLAGKQDMYGMGDVGKYQQSTQAFDQEKLARDTQRQRAEYDRLIGEAGGLISGQYDPLGATIGNIEKYQQSVSALNPQGDAALRQAVSSVNLPPEVAQRLAATGSFTGPLKDMNLTQLNTSDLNTMRNVLGQINAEAEQRRQQAAAMAGKKIRIIPKK